MMEWAALWQSGLEVVGKLADSSGMDTLATYRKQALKLAEIEKLDGNEGYVALIPGFRGLIGTGRTRKEALADLEAALEGWVGLALKRGIGLPAVSKREREAVTAA
jgi:predicted RNase H-like HicB family nuclease